jgi:hypothetical protein
VTWTVVWVVFWEGRVEDTTGGECVRASLVPTTLWSVCLAPQHWTIEGCATPPARERRATRLKLGVAPISGYPTETFAVTFPHSVVCNPSVTTTICRHSFCIDVGKGFGKEK